MSVTHCCEYLPVLNDRPVEVVLLSRGGLVRRVSEEASDSEQALAVFEGAAEPTVVLFGFLGRPADIDSLCTVPTQLTVQLICIYPPPHNPEGPT